MRTHAIKFVLGTSALAVLCGNHANAQATRGANSFAAGQQQTLAEPGQSVSSSSSTQTLTQRISALKKSLQDAKTADEKNQAKSSTSKWLGEYFDGDMEHRKSELDRLKKRSEEMSALLAKRAAAKVELVALQLKSIKNEADGLGLFSEQRASLFLNVPALGPVAQAVQPAEQSAFAAYPPANYGQRNWEGTGTSGSAADPRATVLKRVQDARRKLAAADSPDAEPKATAELKAALDEYFDRDLEFRRKELEEVNQGLKKSEERLQKRASAKESIVELQLQLIVNEAEGLGFFSGSNAGSNQPGSGWPVGQPNVPYGFGTTTRVGR